LIKLVDVGLPPRPRVPITTWQPEPGDIAGWLPRRSATIHKYSAGAVLALAGSPHFVGAPILCTAGALRTGAGYVTLAGQQETLAVLATRLLEVTMLTLPADNADALKHLNEVASRYTALLIGPGLGRSDSTTRLVLDALSGAVSGPKSAVVDADGLYALSVTKDWWKMVTLPLVLTPHTGEMARLTGLATHAIESDRLNVAASYAQTWQHVVVLKGAPTIVAAPDGQLSIVGTGNPLLATAGTGDVLSGIISALLAGGAPPFDAARAGVYLHGLAADLAIPRFGDRGMVAGDLLELIPQAIKRVLSVSPDLAHFRSSILDETKLATEGST
jgi:NAD(P)H-hydrate epimerase